VIPLGRSLQSQSKPGFSNEKPGIFIFILLFTKQVLFSHSENKNHPPDGGWFALALRREGDCLRRSL